MNTVSRRVPVTDPHLRKRGASSRIPVNVSPIARQTDSPRLIDCGTLSCVSITATRAGSVAFQIPAIRNTAAIKIAAVQFNAVLIPQPVYCHDKIKRN